MRVGFIGYRRSREANSAEVVRIFLECQEEAAVTGQSTDRAGELPDISYTYAVDVVFPGGKAPCLLRGVDEILVLKKFYKLIFSLEERARERGHDRQQALESAEGLLEHLSYTRNARDFALLGEPRQRLLSHAAAEPECRPVAAEG